MWRGIERRAREALAQEDPGERARALIALLRRADEDWTWDEDPHAGWSRRADAFAPVMEALASAGPEAVDAILATGAPPGTWYAGAAAMALDRLHGRGAAAAREQDALEWLMRNAADQDDAYMDAAASIVDRMGARSVEVLSRYVSTVEDATLAMPVGFAFLEGADPAWAAPAAEAMLRRLAEEGAGLDRVLGPATALFCLRGPEAVPAALGALERATGVHGADAAAPLGRAQELLDGLGGGALGDGTGDDDLEDGGDPFGAWTFLARPGARPLPCAGPDGGCGPGCPLADPFIGPEDVGAVPRFLLERACEGLGLGTGGPKRELAARLWEHHERRSDPGLDRETEAALVEMAARALREVRDDLGVGASPTREEIAEDLDRFLTCGPTDGSEPFSRRELDGMTLDELRTVCEDMGLPAKGKRAALVARVLGAQDGRRGR